MISVSNVSMRYGAKVLFEDVSTAFTPGKRYGLTGPNGAGKTTFMRLLTGELDPQKGTVVRPKKFGVLSQDQFAFDAYRVIDTVMMGNKRLWAAMEERDRIHSKPELTDEDATALTTYILSARSEKIPYTYHVSGPEVTPFADMHFSSSREAGKWVYDRNGCAGCHGLNGKGGRRNFNYQGNGLEPTLTKVIGNYTRDELRKKLNAGVPVVNKENDKGPTPPLYMPAWKDKISPPEMEALMDYLFSIAEKQEEF